MGWADVDILTDEVDLGVVHVGSVHRCPLRVRNNSSSLDAVLVVDLRAHPEFSVACPPDLPSGPVADVEEGGAGVLDGALDAAAYILHRYTT